MDILVTTQQYSWKESKISILNTKGINLDLEQIKVLKEQESCAVIAGPGSGKTHTLIAKAQVESKDKEVLALTFTRNAAQELRLRAPRVRAQTIHSLCYNTLGKFDTDYDALLTDYLALKSKRKFDYIMVDEFQDLSSLEMEVVLDTVKPDGKLFFVGDPRQAIFTYCDADGSSIEKSSIKKLYLNKNYRSNQNIVDKLEKIYIRGLTPLAKKRLTRTAILLRTNRHMDALARKLEELGYCFSVRKRGKKYPGDIYNPIVRGCRRLLPNLNLLTIHCAKGLEWKKVITFDWGEREIEKNLHYVAVSRASEEFYNVNNIKELVDIIGNPDGKKKS